MRLKTVTLLIIGLMFFGCGKSSTDSYISKFGAMPDGAVVKKYWFSGAGIDHTYLWQLQFNDKADYLDFIATVRDLEDNVDGLGTDVGLTSDLFPHWWDLSILETLTGKRSRKQGVNCYYFFKEGQDYLVYIQWFDT